MQQRRQCKDIPLANTHATDSLHEIRAVKKIDCIGFLCNILSSINMQNRRYYRYILRIQGDTLEIVGCSVSGLGTRRWSDHLRRRSRRWIYDIMDMAGPAINLSRRPFIGRRTAWPDLIWHKTFQPTNRVPTVAAADDICFCLYLALHYPRNCDYELWSDMLQPYLSIQQVLVIPEFRD
jgi:hypothetical protein